MKYIVQPGPNIIIIKFTLDLNLMNKKIKNGDDND